VPGGTEKTHESYDTEAWTLKGKQKQNPSNMKIVRSFMMISLGIQIILRLLPQQF
jgi:hypothetical protein